MLVRVVRRVELVDLTIKGNFDVELTRAKITGALAISTTTGTVMALDSLFGASADASAYIRSTSGSIYIAETTDRVERFDISYRATMAKACFAVSTGTSGIDANEAASLNLAREQPSCDADRARRHYDADSNGWTTQDEFTTGLEDLGVCVGDGCPHYTSPLTRTQLIFDSGAEDGTTLVQLKDPEFTRRLQANNLSEYIPLCYRSATYRRHIQRVPADFHLTSINRSATLSVQSGEIRVDLTSAVATRAYTRYDPAPNAANRSIVFGKSIDDMLPDIRMLQQDADLLATKLRRFSSPSASSERSVYAVIDVVEGVGVPADRWLYSSNDVYLELNPALLKILSYGFLAPKIARYSVRFTNGDACSDEGIRFYNSSEYIVHARRRVYQEIRAALMVRSQSLLRGEVVRVKARHRLVPYSSNLEAYRKVDAQYEPFDYERTAPGQAQHAFYLSFFLASLTAIFVLVRLLQSMISVRHHADTIEALQRRLLVRYAQKDGIANVYVERNLLTSNLCMKNSTTDGADTKPFFDANSTVDQLGQDDSKSTPIRIVSDEDVVGAQPVQDSSKHQFVSSLKFSRIVTFILRLGEPFLRPISTIDSVLVTPLERSVLESKDTFVRLRCILDSKAAPVAVQGKGNSVNNAQGGEMMSSIPAVAPQKKQSPCVSLDVFMQAHRAFCFNQKLRPISGQTELRQFVQKFNLRLKRRVFPYVVGMRWKSGKYSKPLKDERRFVDSDRYFDEADAYLAQPAINSTPVKAAASQAMLKQFLDECTEVVRDTVLHEKQRMIPACDKGLFSYDGAFAVQIGLLRAFEEWHVEKTGERLVPKQVLPQIRGLLEALCAERGASIACKTELVVHGLRMHNFHAGSTLSRLPLSAYLRAFFVVLLHTCAMLIWPWGLLVCAYSLQLQYAKYGANVVADGQRKKVWLSCYDFGRANRMQPLYRFQDFEFVSRYFIYSSIANVSASLLRQYLHYAGDGSSWIPRVPTAIRGGILAGSALSGAVTVLNWLTFCIMTILWTLAAAVIDPTEYLRYTAAAATIIAVLFALQRELRCAADNFVRHFQQNTRARMRAILGKLAVIERVRPSHASDLDYASGTPDLFADVENDATGDDAEDESLLAFTVIDRQGNGTISFEEIAAFVALLQIEMLDEVKVEQIFAYADKNVDEFLDKDEFSAAWEFIKQEIVSNALSKAGLGASSISTTIAFAFLLLLGTFTFIFWVVAAFTESRTFTAVVEAGLVALSGSVIKRSLASGTLGAASDGAASTDAEAKKAE